MKPLFRFLFAAILLSVAATGCKNDAATTTTQSQSATEKSPTATVQPRKNIIFFGNSLTAAYQLPSEQGFTALLQQTIDSLKLDYTCVNAGLSGETTADGVNRVEWVLQQPVEVFVLELGGNDALRGLPVADSKKNLQAILDKVKTKYPNCKIVLAGMQAPPNLGKTYTTAFRDMYPALAKANGATLIPFLLEGVAANPKLNLEDGIHPNAAGQKIVAKNVWDTLRKVL